MVDNKHYDSNNQGGTIVIEGEGESFKISKRDLVFTKFNHQHHYLPDFTDETDTYVALVCGKRHCPHGALYKKEGKEFMKWLEGHRAKS